MKNLDLFSRRILSVSIAISMILLSFSLLIVSLRSISPAKAEDTSKEWMKPLALDKISPLQQDDSLNNVNGSDEVIQAIQAFGIGIREGNLYFGILYSNNSIGLHKAPADGEDVLDW